MQAIDHKSPSISTIHTAVLALIAVLAATIVLLAPPAQAANDPTQFGVSSFTTSVVDANGDDYSQAEGHPFSAATSFVFNTRPTVGSETGSETPVEDPKTIAVDLPPGFVGNPQATSLRCRTDQLNVGECPVVSQIGIVTVSFLGGVTSTAGVYNMVPTAGHPAEFGFKVSNLGMVGLFPRVRSESDNGLTVTVPYTEQAELISTVLTLWGVPADPAHNPDRYTCFYQGFFCNGGTPSTDPLTPFLTNPASLCTDARPVTTLRVDSWQHPGAFKSYEAPSPRITGCEKLTFDPAAQVVPTSTKPDSPTGLNVDLTFPTGDNGAGLAPPALKKAVVTLPEGMSINPTAASGLQGCGDGDLKLKSLDPTRCPDGSKIGTVTATTPLLAEPLTGGVFIRSQASTDPESGQMFRLALVLENKERGISIRLPGSIRADAGTGRLVTTFDDNPELPVSEIKLAFKDGSRAPLAMPATCGPKTVDTQLSSWGGQVVDRHSTFQVDCTPGLGSFAPSFSAGTTNAVAGASAPFVMRFGRGDGQQELGSINGSLPPGLLGVLASVPLCSAAQGAAGTCSASSRVGKVQVAAGPGSDPLWLPVAGQPEDAVYLTEPYRKGDVAGMSIVVPAVAGPFDLGKVVTKVYLKLRPKDQGIDLQSEQLPRIVGGVPVRIRQVAVTIDRQGFMVNPTNCRAMATYANVFSQSWVKAPVTSRFQVGDCAGLAMSPIITAAVGGKGNTARYTHPALRVTIRQSSAQAHLSKTNVVLPRALNVDLKAPSLKGSCPRPDYYQDRCKPVATVGTVRAVTPLLKEPLTGPAFLIQKKGQLPDIVMRLRNNRMSLDLIGVLDFLKDGRLITRVKGIPDAALSSFVLNIKGGKGGSLLNRSSLCTRKRLVKATFKGQNGKVSYKTPVMHVAGCGKVRAKAKAKARRASRAAAHHAGARASAAADQRAAGGRS